MLAVACLFCIPWHELALLFVSLIGHLCCAVDLLSVSVFIYSNNYIAILYASCENPALFEE